MTFYQQNSLKLLITLIQKQSKKKTTKKTPEKLCKLQKVKLQSITAVFMFASCNSFQIALRTLIT